MSRLSPASTPRDPLRAIFLCLMVLAQLLLPATFERARAAQAEGCVGLADAGSSADKASKQLPHAHGQECAHCRPQAAVLAAPIAHPEVTVVATLETSVAHTGLAIVAPFVQSLPPATGPPAALFQV